jgi:hypothetical protein
MRKAFGEERGASAVEFAIIASVLFLVLFGTIQFGIAYNRYQGLNAAAREGARLGALENTNVDAIRQRVLNSLSILDPSKFSSAYTCPALATDQGCIEVYQESTTSPGTYSIMNSGSSIPCDSAHAGAIASLKVIVNYKMLIQIPLWASPSITASGTGIFKCE